MNKSLKLFVRHVFCMTILLFSFTAFCQVNLESYSGIARTGKFYKVTQDVLITQAINPIPSGIIRISNGGRLRFGSGASIRLGEVNRDGSNAIIYGEDNNPSVKSRVFILEHTNAGSFGADNYNGSSQARFMSGCNVELEGVTWVVETAPRSDFDIKSGAAVHFRNCLVITQTFSYTHFASDQITIDGLVMDNKTNTAGLEFGLGKLPSYLSNLDIVDNHPTSGSRHCVLVNFPGNNVYEINRLKARNISLYSSSQYTTKLINPIGNIQKGQFYNNLLEVYRDLGLRTVNTDNTPFTSPKIYAKRIGGIPFSSFLSVDGTGNYKQQFLQYRQTHGSSVVEDQSIYHLLFADYSKEIKSTIVNIDFVSGLSGENILGDIRLLDDEGISQANSSTVSGYTGIAVNHSNKSVTISENHSLCDIYDFLKYDKIAINMDKPTVLDQVATKSGTELNLSDYDFILTNGSNLTACDKFEKLTTIGTATIADLDNLQVGLSDIANTYKFIRLQGLTDADVSLVDNVQDTVIQVFSGINESLNYVISGNFSGVKLLVNRVGFTTWGTTIDLTTADVFSFVIFQTPKEFSDATEDQQKDMIYLLQKLLLKTQVVQSNFDNVAVPSSTFIINNFNTGISATLENQEEMTRILQLLLKNMTAVHEIMVEE